MNADDRKRLQEERAEIEKRIAEATDAAAKAHLEAQFGERLSHLKARLEADPGGSPPAPAKKTRG